MELQFCCECKKLLKGRSDKKFCDQKCKNNHYNEFRRTRQPIHFRQINQILIHNRNILKELFDRYKQQPISSNEISKEGYLLSYFTHKATDGERDLSFFCYDYGIRKTEDDCFQLVRINERTPMVA